MVAVFFLGSELMQRNDVDGMVIISCDFCGQDWDEVKPMIEGHHGSVLCLKCVELAIAQIGEGEDSFHCTLCLQKRETQVRRYLPERTENVQGGDGVAVLPLLPGANKDAALCIDCLNQAVGSFSKDPDTDWKKPAGKI